MALVGQTELFAESPTFTKSSQKEKIVKIEIGTIVVVLNEVIGRDDEIGIVLAVGDQEENCVRVASGTRHLSACRLFPLFQVLPEEFNEDPEKLFAKHFTEAFDALGARPDLLARHLARRQ